ncbi:hypothetical protein [Paenibacillus rigui]|uniref:Uncharacterized protein n=1 Tax=Paenibacillus rigui TaxID=554312 RepID=A0A229UKT2_9BACL|nr:hypothetical protein [Paenibacillus rigui]OXM83993.1 hypothetical protein CF651_23055 [Paenibacillus rigui]
MNNVAAPAINTYEVRTYDIWDDKEYPKIITAETRSKAKYEYWQLMSDCWDIPFGKLLPMLRVRTIGRFKPSDLFGNRERFERVIHNRCIPFAYMGMRIEVSGKMGTIVGANDSGNLDIIFDGQWWKENCHPWWKTKYFDRNGALIKEYAD